MRVINFATSLLLAGASISGFVNAQPTAIDGQLESRSPEMSVLALTVKSKGDPKDDAKCPVVNSNAERTYTTNQIKVAYLGGAKLAADDKQVGDQKYPHVYSNNEKLPFDCGRDKMEFPIMNNNKIYSGEAPGPDRVVFEYSRGKTELTVKYCGVMRHGPSKLFLNCPKP